MSEERTTEGIIKYWAKEPKEEQSPAGTYYVVGLNIEEVWHNITMGSKAEIDTLKADSPNGSKVKFIEWSSNGTYWNYKAKTFEVLEKGQGFAKKPFIARSRYDSPEQEVREIRGKCLMYARIENKELKEVELIRRAQKLEAYVWMGMKHPIECFGRINSNDGSISEEEVKQANAESAK